MSGLDELVAEAMQRKLIVSPTKVQKEEETPAPPVPASTEERALTSLDASTEERTSDSIDIRRGRMTPDASFAFTVNGVKCVVTIHVEPGATLALSDNTKTAKKAPSGGVKVKGIRGATQEVSEAPEAVFDAHEPISGDNLPEGWVFDPVVGATLKDAPLWLCPDHQKADDRVSAITGRTYTVCPDCGKLAPKT